MRQDPGEDRIRGMPVDFARASKSTLFYRKDKVEVSELKKRGGVPVHVLALAHGRATRIALG
jgi:hypothetical protein